MHSSKERLFLTRPVNTSKTTLNKGETDSSLKQRRRAKTNGMPTISTKGEILDHTFELLYWHLLLPVTVNPSDAMN